jgi:hypothetical protein
MLPIILTAYTLAAINNQAGPVSDPRDNWQDSHTLLAKMKASRDLLKSGTYRASATVLTNGNADDAGPIKFNVVIFSSFDFGKGLLRFDQTRTVIRDIAGEAIPHQKIGKHIRTPELVINWTNSRDAQNLARAMVVGIDPPMTKPLPGISPFDVRSLGLTLWGDLMAGVPFNGSYETWDKGRRIEVFPEANGIYRLRLLQGHRSGTFVPQTLWLDEHQGFSPVRLSYSIPSAEPGQPEWFIFDCRVRWKEEARVWVPASFRIERRVRGRLVEFYTLGIEWISVNEPIQPELFTADGLDVPLRTPVIDFRKAVPEHVGNVKEQPPLK